MDKFFATDLERYSDHPCLIVPGQATLTYRDIITLSDNLIAPLSAYKQLVFIEGANDIGTITAYIGALRAGHAVHLLDRDKIAENAALVATYNPHAIIRSQGGSASIERCHDTPFAIHESIAVLLSTSGSTGSKKLVKLSRDNIDSNARSIASYLNITSGDRAITTLQPYFSLGMSVINSHLSVGASLVLSQHSVQEPAFLSLLKTQSVTNFVGVPYTYQLLHAMGADFSGIASLKFMAQAGGRLAPDHVRSFAKMGRAQGWKFYVMYGQTEASPRMAYLPPDMAEQYPDCIGRAIPGGTLSLKLDDGTLTEAANIEGELVYSGPNVMNGYALSAPDLATIEPPPYLVTGDIAIRNEVGLFKITGRKARFVKPFGLRISLDEVESFLEAKGLRIPVIGTDSEIALCGEMGVIPDAAIPGLSSELAEKYKLPATMFRIASIEKIPRLPTGKVDYPTLKKQLLSETEPAASGVMYQLADFIKGSWLEALSIALAGSSNWKSIEDIFRVHFPKKDVTQAASFMSLGGDSLIHIQMSFCIEDYLGQIPPDWHDMTIEDLEQLHG